MIGELAGLACYVVVGSATLAHLVAPNGVVVVEPAPAPPARIVHARVPDERITITLHLPDRGVRCATSADLASAEDIMVPPEEFDSVYNALGCNS